MEPIMPRSEAAELIKAALIREGLTWQKVAQHIGQPLVWTTSALLGQHPLDRSDAEAVVEVLGISGDVGRRVAESLQRQPTRGLDPAIRSDPTFYRLTEALTVYGPALKELIHEEFGDGILSAINFRVDFARRSDPGGTVS